LQYHLAKIPRNEVGIFSASTPEIVHIANQSNFAMGRKRDQWEELMLKLANRSKSISGAVECQSSSSHSTKPIPSASSPFFVPRSVPMGQSSIRSILKTKEMEKADKNVAKCLLWSDIPFNIAKNPFYHSMFEVAPIVGPGYRGPYYNELRGPLLQGEKANCTKRLDELRESWETTRCTIMSNGWIDGKGRSILNFLVNCPKGTMFIKSIDASAYVKDAQLLCEL
jgi:hypothetical protein